MSNLVEFLLARIADDDSVAFFALQDKGLLGGLHEQGLPLDDHRATHAARWVPARVRAECEAKRRIVEEHPIYRGPRILAVDSSGTDYGCELCHCIDPIRADGIIEANGYCETLLLLALPYADHPDYREEWRS